MKSRLLIVPALVLLMIITVSLLAACSGSSSESGGACALTDLPFPHPEPDYSAKLARDFSPFSAELEAYTPEQAAAREALVSGKTVLEMQSLMESGELTSAELVVYYLERIQRYDVDKLNAVLELNPDALEIAQALDDERAAGNVRGDMHGIPVLLKDNIAAGDQMHTAAGAAAMLDWDPSRDAFLVSQLREAGAVILGKANLSEWANWMDECMPNGFSTNGGQTRNPYGPFDTSGSSSGSAVSVAADLTTVSVGTETQGSIISPAGHNSVVALKPSKGLISTDYVIPHGQNLLQASQDTAITAAEFAQKGQENNGFARNRIDATLEAFDIDLVISDMSQLYAPAGYPALTVPAGYDENGRPQPVVFIGGFLSEPQLLAVGYAFEQQAQAWVAPDLEAAMASIEALGE
ncbi:MAG: amidase family protein [Candidatus Promineifilaceae bacterium]|nr:amidase family protein [Candidatus Promineifilaceae bacterium]